MDNNASIASPIFVSSSDTQEMNMHTGVNGYIRNTIFSAYSDYIIQLLRLGQLLCTLTEKHIEFLCQEIKAITQQRASLHLSDQMAFPPNTFSILPLQFNNFRYGYLAIASDETDQQQPAIPLFSAHLMAQGISYILHILEQHLLIRSLRKQTRYWTSSRLTRREQEILSLICRGYTQEEIAELLSISLTTVGTHRQHIYEHLNVHNEYDARIAAYDLKLFSFLAFEATGRAGG
ncbi:MAG TPA: LuxR C-terminal-related transcriptional regulator [Ktedonobacteraceae bacterium]|nr:LuxR C-terminal-related transcriptional regulator [Ktedonobacteraceae bacterium]